MIKHFILPESGALVVPAYAAARFHKERKWEKWFYSIVDEADMELGKDFFIDFMCTPKSGVQKKELMAFFNPSSLIQRVAVGSPLYSALELLIGTYDATLSSYDLAEAISVDVAYINQRAKAVSTLKPQAMFTKKFKGCLWQDCLVNVFTKAEIIELFKNARSLKAPDFHDVQKIKLARIKKFWNPENATDKRNSAYLMADFERIYSSMRFDGNPLEKMGEIFPKNVSWLTMDGQAKAAAKTALRRAERKTSNTYKPLRKAPAKRPEKIDRHFKFNTPVGVTRTKADAETVANFGRHGV